MGFSFNPLGKNDGAKQVAATNAGKVNANGTPVTKNDDDIHLANLPANGDDTVSFMPVNLGVTPRPQPQGPEAYEGKIAFMINQAVLDDPTGKSLKASGTFKGLQGLTGDPSKDFANV